MNPAKLNRRILLQRKSNGTEDDSGYPTDPAETWEDVMTLYASREPLRGREFFTAAAANAELTLRYKIRYRDGITPDMRFKDLNNGRICNITAVLDDPYGDRTETHLMALEEHMNG
ncbi:SPP1 family predicted phage head-tail adaptor [Paenibacillus sp. 4624]|uniref:phage head closure protein n=1 Tax=Paenibacillus sp. 4624 TaxID=3156453 RepID=UPI003D1B512C